MFLLKNNLYLQSKTVKHICIVENTKFKNRFDFKADDPMRAWINKHFLIKYKVPGIKGTHLVSAGRYAALLEKHAPTVRLGAEKTKDKHFEKVKKSTKAKIPFQLREGIYITFISK